MTKKTNTTITLIAALFLLSLLVAVCWPLGGLMQAYPLLFLSVIALLLALSMVLHIKKRRKRRSAERQLREIDDMEGYLFEEYIAALLQKHGYTQVEVTRKSGDYGADITAALGEEMIGFQCKRSQQNVGVQGVKDISAGMQYYGCAFGVVVTNRYFTRQARELAEKCGIGLWDRDNLKEMLGKK